MALMVPAPADSEDVSPTVSFPPKKVILKSTAATVLCPDGVTLSR